MATKQKCYSCDEGQLKEIKDKPYEYTECGLDNVIIYGLTQYECKDCGELFVSIPKIEQLHMEIGRLVCCNEKSLLTSDEIKFIRKELHLKAKNLARVLGVSPTTVSRWENGKQEISDTGDRLIRNIYMSFASEQMGGAVKHDVLSLFFELSSKRKVSVRKKKIQITPMDWMLGEFNFCSSP